jgi:hypothetical protein
MYDGLIIIGAVSEGNSSTMLINRIYGSLIINNEVAFASHRIIQ